MPYLVISVALIAIFISSCSCEKQTLEQQTFGKTNTSSVQSRTTASTLRDDNLTMGNPSNATTDTAVKNNYLLF